MDLTELLPKKDIIVVELKAKGEPILDDDGKPMTWTLHAPHTDFYKEIEYARIDANLKDSADSKDYKPSAKKLIEGTLEFLAAITQSWHIQIENKHPRLSEKKAFEILKRYPSIKNQVEEALDKEANFI